MHCLSSRVRRPRARKEKKEMSRDNVKEVAYKRLLEKGAFLGRDLLWIRLFKDEFILYVKATNVRTPIAFKKLLNLQIKTWSVSTRGEP